MKLIHLLQAYNFDELMPIINDMFPGTNKFRDSLEQAYNLMLGMKPVDSKKAIRYKILHDDRSSDSYMGAEDADFNSTWDVCLGKDVTREKGVDLSDDELAANCLVNLCLLGRYPASFESPHKQMIKG